MRNEINQKFINKKVSKKMRNEIIQKFINNFDEK